MAKREFNIADEYRYDQTSAVRWIVSHLLRYKLYLVGYILPLILSVAATSLMRTLAGAAFDEVLQTEPGQSRLLAIFLGILGVVIARLVFGLTTAVFLELWAQSIERDTRDELYLNLLGKSQTFHNRQRVGDIMARASNDVGQLNWMVAPGLDLIVKTIMGFVMPMIFIGFIRLELLLSPLLFTVLFMVLLSGHMRRLGTVTGPMRRQFGLLNANVAEVITGIELVKSTAQEALEKQKLNESARGYRNLSVQEGEIRGRYLPTLFVVFALISAFLHGLLFFLRGQLSVGDLVAYLSLMMLLRGPISFSIWAFSLVRLGVAAGERILALIKEETELDENEAGYQKEIKGEIVFENVSFGYDTDVVLKNISFHVEPGQVIAIVGQTGAGKSTLTDLVNRLYDVDEGRILIDGVDVREWRLDSLRSQIATIEQEVFLFSRSIFENIAFGPGQRADRPSVEQAARQAQAHDFIMSFKDGYDTIIGERGVTLSGGQRQRLAIARALLTDPRILILDDCASAIDSATEDEIQRAIRRVLKGRTTLLVTHRLSQIRQADKILVLRQSELVDQGTHAELSARCQLYRRIFIHYD